MSQYILPLSLALLIFLSLRLTIRLLRTIKPKRTIRGAVQRIFPIFEFFVWLSFTMWVINSILGDFQHYNLLLTFSIILLIMVITWYFIRDFVAGIVIRSETQLEVNQLISLQGTTGLLKKIGYRTIEIEEQSGARVKIPYSQIATEKMSFQSTNETLRAHEVSLTTSSNQPIQVVKDSIVAHLMRLPWVSINHEPSVNLFEQRGSNYSYRVKFYCISSRHATHVEQELKEKFEGNSNRELISSQ